MTTPRKASVQRAKREAYFKAGTCGQCGGSIVGKRSRAPLCRRCRKAVEQRAFSLREDVIATEHFRYYLLCRKKAESDIGKLARDYFRLCKERPSVRVICGLEALAAGTTADEIDVKILEAAWEASETERCAASA